jgi:MurNAc alpha-1-phosphate uridylyltransferase
MLPLAILAGGYSTRLGSLTKDLPKCLVQINGRPFVEWQLDLLVESGYLDFIFCLSYKSEMIQEYLADGSRWGSRIRYSIDGETQLGTGGAIQKALPLLGDAFGVIYGDSYLPIDYSNVESEFLNSNSQGFMTVYKNQDLLDTSNVEYIGGKLINYEKGTHNRKMHHIDYGLTYFRKEAFESRGSEVSFDLSSICHLLASEGKLDGFEVFQRFYEIGSVSGIKDLSEYLRRVPGDL